LNQRKYKTYNAPMLPIVHGTFAAPKKQFDDYSFSGPVIPRMKRETEKGNPMHTNARAVPIGLPPHGLPFSLLF
jgi:hypothetical protein